MLDPLSFLVGGAIFLFVAIFVYSLVLNDEPAKRIGVWLAMRKNAPNWLRIPAMAAFALGLVYLVLGYGTALGRVLAMVHFEPWVWISFIAGLIALLLLNLITRVIRRRESRQPPASS